MIGVIDNKTKYFITLLCMRYQNFFLHCQLRKSTTLKVYLL